MFIVEIDNDITLTATIISLDNSLIPTGVVIFKNGSITLGVAGLTPSSFGATAMLKIPARKLGLGSHTIISYYAGDTNFKAVSSIPTTYEIVEII